MDADRYTRLLFSFFLAALLCGCGGGGGGSAALPPVPAGTQATAAPAAAPQSVAFTITLPAPGTSAARRLPRYVSAGTKSATIAYGGHTQVINCSNNTCSGLLAVAPGQVTFVASLYDQANGAGNLLAQGQTNTTIMAAQPNRIQITFGGVVASLALTLGTTSVTAGSPASVPVTVTAKDAAGYTIVGNVPYVVPIVLADDDASGATSLSATSLAAPDAPVPPDAPLTLAYTGNGGPNAVHLSARLADGSAAAASATLTIAAKPTPAPTATPAPTPAPTLAPTPVPGPSQNPRSVVWSVGDPWGLPSSADGQGADKPVFSGSPATCVAEQSAAQCTGGSGAVSFHVQRPDTTTIPAGEYRNMMIVQKWNADHTYAFNYQLVPGGAYDVRFQTVNHMPDDAQYVQSLIWQNHAGDGTVMTALGIDNPDGRGNQFYFNSGGHEGGIADPFTWHGAATQGGVDSWEIQFRNAQDASGWIDMYRNGRLEVHYSGPVVKTTAYDLMSFGIYYYDWEIQRSTILSTDLTFNYFELSTIPGPVAPAAYGT